MAQLVREVQLNNVFTLEHIDEQIDQIFELKNSIEYLKREILTVRKRQLSYLSELYDLYKLKDREIDTLSLQLSMSHKQKEIVEQRRDEAFSQLIDLMAERRQILSMVQDRADMIGMRYIDSRADEQERRLQSHETAEQTLRVWSTKISVKGLSASDPEMKKEAEFKLQQMLKELELKQKQLMKLYQQRDQAELKKKEQQKQQLINGNLEESIELLNLFARECKEDTRDIKLQLKEAANEFDRVNHEVRLQESAL